MSQTSPSNNAGKTKSVLFPFLGSMNLAVSLLMMLAIASVVGTVLKQDQSIQDYVIKFGPFWAEVFKSMGLYHVYGAAWFTLVLLFLLVSTGTCVVRNAPAFMRDMKQFSEKLSFNAYKHQPHHAVLPLSGMTQAQAQTVLTEQGYKTKVHQNEDGFTVAGMKGQWNRIGYFFTHISIIIICIGGLFDSNFILKYRELTGDLKAETRSVPLSQVAQESWLGSENFSFRGSVNVPEGDKTDVLFLPYEEGFLVQKLPFMITLKDFRVEFYDTGKPKSFESDIIFDAPDLDGPVEQTIRVNHPFYYKNYAIYQSSFNDGGSLLSFNAYSLHAPIVTNLAMETAVNKVETLNTPDGTYKVELNDFKMFNVVPTSDEEREKTGKKVHNNGPTVIFKVRNDQGKAWEYENYFVPSMQEGRLFFISGMRTAVSEPYRYVFIPADSNRSKQRFFEFLALLNNPVETVRILAETFPKTEDMDNRTYELQLRLMQQLVALFRNKGFNGVTEFVEKTVPEADRQKVSDYYFAQTSIALQTLFVKLLQDEKNFELGQEISAQDKQWFDDALVTVTAFLEYGPPLFFDLTTFKHIQASGLQITKSPGKDVVYFGCAMLIIGVFFLFYVRQKRVWIAYNNQTNELIIAGKDAKNLPEMTNEFAQLKQKIEQSFVDASSKKQEIKNDNA